MKHMYNKATYYTKSQESQQYSISARSLHIVYKTHTAHTVCTMRLCFAKDFIHKYRVWK